MSVGIEPKISQEVVRILKTEYKRLALTFVTLTETLVIGRIPDSPRCICLSHCRNFNMICKALHDNALCFLRFCICLFGIH